MTVVFTSPRGRSRRASADAELLAWQVGAIGLPLPVREFKFHDNRQWRFDVAWPDRRLAIEIEGGAFTPGGSRHTRGAGFRRDLEKYVEATLAGWTVVRILPEHIEKGMAIGWVERLLTGRGPSPKEDRT